MKSKTLCITTLTLLTALSVPLRLAAQDTDDHKGEHRNHSLQTRRLGGRSVVGSITHGSGGARPVKSLKVGRPPRLSGRNVRRLTGAFSYPREEIITEESLRRML